MAMKKGIAIWGRTGILVISACLVLPVMQAGAETMKFKLSTVVTQGGSYPAGGVEGHDLIFFMTDGVAALENGDVGSMKGLFISDSTPKGGSFSGYLTLTFTDGSTILLIQTGTFSQDPEEAYALIQQASGELLNGSGRFGGINGVVSTTGKLLKPTKGEGGFKAYHDFILTYTLP